MQRSPGTVEQSADAAQSLEQSLESNHLGDPLAGSPPTLDGLALDVPFDEFDDRQDSLARHAEDPFADDPVARAEQLFDEQMQALNRATPDFPSGPADPYRLHKPLYGDPLQQLLNPFGMPGPMG